MKDKLISYLKRANEKRRLTGYIAVIFAVIFLFLFFLPLLCTFSQGEKESILGFFSFPYLSDDFDIIHYAISLLAISIAVTCFYFIAGLIHLFCSEKNITRARLACLGLIIIKTICDVIFVILATQTSTNIELDWGGYLLPCIDVVFIIATVYFQINHVDSDALLFQKEAEEKEDSVQKDSEH